jgi:hypothetical protein
MTPCLFVIGEDIRRAWQRRFARTATAQVQPGV